MVKRALCRWCLAHQQIHDLFLQECHRVYRRREKDELEFEKIPTPSTFNYCQLNLRTEVCYVSDQPSDAMSRIQEIEAAQNIDDLRESHSITGKLHPNFETLDARIATALKKDPDEHEVQ